METTAITETYLTLFSNLLVALAIGFLIGLERGWSKRELEPGRRIAGIRTFGLISLLGGLTMLLGRESSIWVIALAFGGLGLLVASAAFIEAQRTGEYGITTEVAAFIAFILGALAMTPHAKLAAATAVITAIILGTKPLLHQWVRKLAPEEIYAVFKLLLISVVMLPILPRRTYDPWGAFNPYEIWWMVVLICAISFVGYFAVKIAGAGRGILLTGILGGLVSSTAVTLSLSRMAKASPEGHRIFAAGVIAASTTMFPRILMIAGVLRPKLSELLLWPILLVTGLGYLFVWWLVRGQPRHISTPTVHLQNPFEFGTALRFGLLLAGIIWLTQILKNWLGSVGIYLTAAISGMTDVDAITLSLARLAEDPAMLKIAAWGILLAAVVNTIVKAGMTVFIAGGAMARYVTVVFVLMLVVGTIGLSMSL
ncbi:MAG: hypothetical protein AXA67_12585 [Methylothermaceae bacteria B42]|nr:MAG: hypothetical protein AXA67_12585 [Methylothermaceae bacteria B42]HHJ37990.1 MgtC/SapB family protein [Methylothermaceae bacterium]